MANLGRVRYGPETVTASRMTNVCAAAYAVRAEAGSKRHAVQRPFVAAIDPARAE